MAFPSGRPRIVVDIEQQYAGQLFAYVCFVHKERWGVAVCLADPRERHAIPIDRNLYAHLPDEHTAVRFVNELNQDRGVTAQMRFRIIRGQVPVERASLWLRHIQDVVGPLLTNGSGSSTESK
jgi:hypothetical protein